MTDDDLRSLENTPLVDPLPTEPTERVRRLARDMAWGAVNGYWSPRVEIKHNFFQYTLRDDFQHFRIYAEHWDGDIPLIHMLSAFGYMTISSEGDAIVGVLTEKAFALLELPLNEPSIFISYRRRHSTAFALLIEARLRIAGNKNVFVDKMLEIGGDWRAELERRVAECDVLIVLVGETTFESEWVRREVEIAATNDATIIPIWHPDIRRNDHTPQVINDRQEIRVERETAEGYETAISKLLHRLGYATY
jgi:hypothetical protein